ncbi:polysaccharide biosynthesis protein [unidentified eubacterium SCB49]|nr:polysaccharide biosynthesis protein [unidentified eubacterium SCB49]
MYKKLFKQTFIYGLATVLPRAFAFVLVPLYTSVLEPASFGVYATLMAYIVLGNVLLSYGMETAFFRFINKEGANRSLVQSTALTSITATSIAVFVILYFLKDYIANYIGFDTRYVVWSIEILVLDALVVIPFVWFRANGKPLKYAFIKILNVIINLGFNLFFFMALPEIDELVSLQQVAKDPVDYIFWANIIASAATLIMVIPVYFNIKFKFNVVLWKQMIKYAYPVLIAGIAFSINEVFDKILLDYLLPKDIAETEVGVYAACYKLGVFMTLFATAFRLGIEPFFFNHAKEKNAKNTYAVITKYFTIFGCIIFLVVMVYIDILKEILIRNEAYWVAISIVPYILLANLCLGIYHNLSVWYKVTDRTRYGAYISVFGAIITLAVNFVLIPIISYKGAAIATLAAYGCMMLASYFLGRKYYRVPYEVKKIVTYILAAITFGSLAFYTFDRSLLIGTALLLVFLLGVFILEKKELKKMISK